MKLQVARKRTNGKIDGCTDLFKVRPPAGSSLLFWTRISEYGHFSEDWRIWYSYAMSRPRDGANAAGVY